MDTETRDGPPRALMIAAIVVAVAAVVAILVVAALRQTPATDKPVAIVSVPAPQADSAECRALVDALPEQLGDFQPRARGRSRTAGGRGMARHRRRRGGDPAVRSGAARGVRSSAVPFRWSTRWRGFGWAKQGWADPGVDRTQPGSPWTARCMWRLTLPAGSGPDTDPGDLAG